MGSMAADMGLWIGTVSVLGSVGVVVGMPLASGSMIASLKASNGLNDVIHKKCVRKAVRILGSDETLEPEVDPGELEA